MLHLPSHSTLLQKTCYTHHHTVFKNEHNARYQKLIKLLLSLCLWITSVWSRVRFSQIKPDIPLLIPRGSPASFKHNQKQPRIISNRPLQLLIHHLTLSLWTILEAIPSTAYPTQIQWTSKLICVSETSHHFSFPWIQFQRKLKRYLGHWIWVTLKWLQQISNSSHWVRPHPARKGFAKQTEGTPMTYRFIVVVVYMWTVQRATLTLQLWPLIKWVDHHLLRALDLTPTKWTPLALRILNNSSTVYCHNPE